MGFGAISGVSLAVSGGPAFVGVFSVFIAAFVVLAVVTLRWAVRRDRVGRAEWLRRNSEDGTGPSGTPSTGRAPAATNGRAQAGQRGSRPSGPRGQGKGTGRGRGPGNGTREPRHPPRQGGAPR